jgi:hypothetical protein
VVMESRAQYWKPVWGANWCPRDGAAWDWIRLVKRSRASSNGESIMRVGFPAPAWFSALIGFSVAESPLSVSGESGLRRSVARRATAGPPGPDRERCESCPGTWRLRLPTGAR